MKIKIRRQDTADSAPYWQTFDFADEGRITAAGILDRLNYRDDLTDETASPAGGSGGNAAACRKCAAAARW